MATGLVRIFGFFVLLLAPIQVYAFSLSCCECVAEENNKSLCALIPDSQSCDYAATKINEQTDGSYTVSCKYLGPNGCRKISDNTQGKCIQDPIAFDKVDKRYFEPKSQTGDVSYTSGTPMALNVGIPGVELPDKLVTRNNAVQIPYLAIYINGFFNYLIGIGFIAAAIMLVYGGIMYIVASTGAKAADAKDKIKDALMGLAIILSSVVILANINPNTTNSGAMQVTLVSAVSTPEDPEVALKMVEDAARRRWVDEGIIEDDFTETGEVSPIYRPKDSDVARNAQGRLVAQEECPADMVAIMYSADYKVPGPIKYNEDVSSFCIDRFEAPNTTNRNRKPYSGVLGIEAAWWCDQRGKRLCSDAEWVRACLGPKGENIYGYGPDFIPGYFYDRHPHLNWPYGIPKPEVTTDAPCNYDSQHSNINRPLAKRDKIFEALSGRYYPVIADGSILVPEDQNSALADEKYAEVYYAALEVLRDFDEPIEPSGSRPACRTEEGVYDMLGNMQEIVIKDRYVKQTIDEIENYNRTAMGGPYDWMNFYWSPVAHQGNKKALPKCTLNWGAETHPLSWRAFENGFRCCMDLETAAEAAVKVEKEKAKAALKIETDAIAEAGKSKVNTCNTTPATEGMECVKLQKGESEGEGTGQYTCLSGYCRAPKDSSKKCCKKNE